MAFLTLQQRLEQTAHRPSGFDWMRIGLASAVALFHAFHCSYGDAGVQAPIGFRPAIGLILPMFFALSGFLVAGSLERSRTVVTFLGLRVVRIVPALMVEVVLSALVLGPLVTTDDLRTYASNPAFYTYFLNIVGDIHYVLPGVFHNNPVPETVNGQLWTLPAEFKCYLLLAGMALLGVARNRWLLLAVLVALFAQQVHAALTVGDVEAMMKLRSSDLIRSFLAGLVLYRFRDKIPFRFGLFMIAALASWLMLMDLTWERFAFLPVAYVTVYLGLLNPPRHSWMLSGDYSYGLYLYGSAIQQTVALDPALREWYWNLLIGYPLSFALAVGSWWLVEKPSLGLRRHLKLLEDAVLKALNWIPASSAVAQNERQRFAYITAITTDDYLLGTLALNASLKASGAGYPLVTVVTDDVSELTENTLRCYGIDTLRVPQLNFPHRSTRPTAS